MAFWKKWSKKPWWRIDIDPVTGQRKVAEWNGAMLDAAKRAGAVGVTDEEIINEHLEWLENKDSEKPWIKTSSDGLLRRWNKAAVKDAGINLKVDFPEKVDEQRELLNKHLNRESGLGGDKPFMQANHYGFAEDGAVKMELDWNRSFINHLRDYGFEGDEDLDVVKSYLGSLTSKPPQEQMIEAFDQLRDWAARTDEGEDVLKALESKVKEAKRARRKR